MMSEGEPFLLGAIPSPRDDRDWIIEDLPRYSRSLKTQLPAKLDHSAILQPVRDQGSQGTCVAQVGSCVKEFHDKPRIKTETESGCLGRVKKVFGPANYLSPQFIYYYRANSPGSGMWPRNLFEILQKRGVCSEDAHRYGNLEEPTEDAKDEALNHRISNYARVSSIDGLKMALFKKGLVLITFDVYNYSKYFWRKNPSDKLKGGHAVTVVGYDKEGFIIRNSWGTNWGDKGYTKMEYGEWGLHNECWSSVDL